MRLPLTAFFLAVSVFSRSQTICVDPGHPSEVGIGTQGKHISEVHAVWLVARKLQAELVKRGFNVVLTKSAERQKVTNKRRAEIANAANADLFLRLHCDAGSKPGFATYYPGASGRVKGVTGPSNTVLARSKQAGRLFHPVVARSLAGFVSDRGLHTEMGTAIGAKQGALTGSIYSKVPVLLVELAVLQNKHDDEFIATDQGQSIYAAALANGVEAVLQGRPLVPVKAGAMSEFRSAWFAPTTYRSISQIPRLGSFAP